MLGGCYPNFHNGRLCSEMSLAPNCFQEQIQFPLNKKLKHRTTTMCTFPIKGLSRLFGCTYTCTTECHFSLEKIIRVCQDKNWCSCLLNLNVPDFRNSKVSGVGSSTEKPSMWGVNLSLKKTMSENSLITTYALRNISPNNINIQKFCNLDCLASSYIWQVDTGHVYKFRCFNIT